MKRPGLSHALASATLFIASAGGALLLAQDAKPAPAPKAGPPPMAAPKRLTSEEILQRFDKNGDGRIDDDERADAREQMMKEQVAQQMARAAAFPGGPVEFRALVLERFDKNRDGRLDDEERAEANRFAAANGLSAEGEVREDLMRRFDRNANGRIDDDERGALQAFVRERLAAAPSTARDSGLVELERVVRSAVEADPAQRISFDRDADGKLSDAEWGMVRDKLVHHWQGTPAVARPSPEQEQKRLEAIAAEVARRRQLREQGVVEPKAK